MAEKTPAPPAPAEHIFDGSRSGFRESGWEYHEGKGSVWLSRREGLFRLIVKRPQDSKFLLGIHKGGRLEWNIDWKDAGNRIEYVLERKSLQRTVITAGKSSLPVKRPVNMSAGPTWNLEFDIRRNRIEIRSGGKVLDAYDRPDPSQPLGKSGFEGDVELKPQ
jgi:hypothetical protein